MAYDTKLSILHMLLKVYSLLFTLRKTISILSPILFFLPMPCHRSCIGRPFIISKRKVQTEMDVALAAVLPYLTLEKPKKKRNLTVTSFLMHLVQVEHLMKTNKLPPPPVVGKLPYINMKISWDGSQEFSVWVMLDCGANMPILLQSFINMHKVPSVLRNHSCGLTMADGSEANTNAVRAYTCACTLRCGNHFSRESFEISLFQSAHEIILPW